MARGAHLSSSSRAAVARWYAQKYVNTAAFRRIAAQFGGAAAAKPIVQAGCLAGFQARGRP
jgi:ferric-dicitrate binding protein FerR (iron transport regulator)